MEFGSWAFRPLGAPGVDLEFGSWESRAQGPDLEFGFWESRASGDQGLDLEFGSWESRALGHAGGGGRRGAGIGIWTLGIPSSGNSDLGTWNLDLGNPAPGPGLGIWILGIPRPWPFSRAVR